MFQPQANPFFAAPGANNIIQANPAEFAAFSPELHLSPHEQHAQRQPEQRGVGGGGVVMMDDTRRPPATTTTTTAASSLSFRDRFHAAGPTYAHDHDHDHDDHNHNHNHHNHNNHNHNNLHNLHNHNHHNNHNNHNLHNNSHHHHNHNHNHNPHHHLHHLPPPSAGLPSARYPTMDSSDIEAQEALAREYNPGLTGPLVGEKTSSQAIAEEYAKADPVYVAKTTVLPQKYSHYRPVLGDGNCGWRAAGYSYFETLLRLQDRSRFEEEMARMISLNNLLATAGAFQPWLFEDMVEQTTDLLRDMAARLDASPQEAGELLRQRFNDPAISNQIIYHLRLLASAWFKANVTLYEGFIPDDHGVSGYTKQVLEPVNMEIDHLGMTLLIDVLLKPIGVSVEIVYLDRSPGSQANTHLFQSLDAHGQSPNAHGPMIYLLFRPNHYDILYKDHGPATPAVPEAPRPTSLQVHRATNLSRHQPIQSTPLADGYPQMDAMALLSCLPGYSLPPQAPHAGFPTPYPPALDAYPPSPMSASMSASMSPVSPGAASAATATPSRAPATFPGPPQPSPTSLNPPHTPLSSSHLTFPHSATPLPIHTHRPPPSQPRRSIATHVSLSGHAALPPELSSPSSAVMPSFRPSKYELESAAGWPEGPVVFQTSTFKNSHYNTAHYNNPHFQPEEWTPESDELPVKRRSS